MRTILMIAGLAGAMILPISAQRIPNRNERLDSRIDQGVRSGELTRMETAKLRRDQALLNYQVRRDRIDGHGLTSRERARIESRQDHLNRQIWRQKHDRQDRF